MQTDGLTDDRTDMTKLIVAFHNFANAPKIIFGRNISIEVTLILLQNIKYTGCDSEQ